MSRKWASAEGGASAAAAGFGVLQLDFSIVNVALPTIQRELHMAPADLQWIVTGYALTFGSLLLAGGRVADLLGRRRLLVLGLVLFGVASLTCGLAVDPIMLIISRFAQGAAGAMVSPAALSLLTTSNAEGPARTRALSIWQATTAAGATAGIIAGGLLTQYLGWRAVFLVNPPLIAVMLALVPRLPACLPQSRARIDYWGALLVTGALAVLIFGLSNGQQHGFTSAASIGSFALAVLLAAGFVISQRTLTAPMLPLRILADPARRAAIAAMLMIGAVLAGYVYFISLYLQHVQDYSPVRTGLSLLPSTLTIVLTTTFGTRRLLARFTVKHVLIAGLACMAAGQAWLAQLSVGSGYAADVAAGPDPDRARRRVVPAERVRGHHQRRAGLRPGAGRSTVHHQSADRRGDRPGHPRHRRRHADGARHRVGRAGPDRRVPAVIPHRRRNLDPRDCHIRQESQDRCQAASYKRTAMKELRGSS